LTGNQLAWAAFVAAVLFVAGFLLALVLEGVKDDEDPD
jgi:hypothetical protein